MRHVFFKDIIYKQTKIYVNRQNLDEKRLEFKKWMIESLNESLNKQDLKIDVME